MQISQKLNIIYEYQNFPGLFLELQTTKFLPFSFGGSLFLLTGWKAEDPEDPRILGDPLLVGPSVSFFVPVSFLRSVSLTPYPIPWIGLGLISVDKWENKLKRSFCVYGKTMTKISHLICELN